MNQWEYNIYHFFIYDIYSFEKMSIKYDNSIHCTVEKENYHLLAVKKLALVETGLFCSNSVVK